MKKIKLLLILTLACGAMMVTTSCSKKSKANNEEKEQTYAWPLATCSTDDTITNVFAVTFAEQVKKLSNGKMKIQVYSNSTLGGDRELLESCKDGDIPFVVQSPATQVSFMPQLCVFDSPCAFDTIEQARKAVDDPEFLSKIKDIYKDAGYQLLAFGDQGFRVMTTKKEFTGYESFKGQKIRTMENNFHIQFWKALGANPTPMSFSEVYIGLQQGTIDAQENAYEIIVSAKLYEQQKKVIETNAVPDYISLIVSDSFYKGLKPEQQKIVREASKIAQETARSQADTRRDKRVSELTKDGMEIVQVDKSTWKKMQESSSNVYNSIQKQSGKELFDLYMKNSTSKH
ncbi:MAG: TRAP transporter substrate-binding protein [Anaerostipes sp.]|nr:TRAP transporter substrate-binding protein [Anaerostipes sp.]